MKSPWFIPINFRNWQIFVAWLESRSTGKYQQSVLRVPSGWTLGNFVDIMLYSSPLAKIQYTVQYTIYNITCVPAISYDHIIRRSKLFLVQVQLEMSDLQNQCGSRGSQYGKRISEAQRWILNKKILWAWGCLDSPTGTSSDVVFKAETMAYLSAMDYLF